MNDRTTARRNTIRLRCDADETELNGIALIDVYVNYGREEDEDSDQESPIKRAIADLVDLDGSSSSHMSSSSMMFTFDTDSDRALTDLPNELRSRGWEVVITGSAFQDILNGNQAAVLHVL